MPTRSARSALLVASAVALVPAGPAAAQFRDPVRIDDVKIGLPPGVYVTERDAEQKGAYVVKRNTWAPVYVSLEVKKEYDGGVRLRIESSDADDLKTTLTVPLARTLAGWTPGAKIRPDELGYLPYVRSGDRSGEVTLTLISDPADGGDPKTLSEPYKVRFQQFRDANSYVVMSLGSKLPGFDLPQEKGTSTTTGARARLRGGRIETSAVTNVREMPDQWFGYAAADLVVLTTGTGTGPEFLDELFDEQKSRPFRERRDALLEWVRRGGKLVVSCGSRSATLAQHALFRDLLPVPLRTDPATRDVSELRLSWQVARNTQDGLLRGRTPTFPVARLAPPAADRPVQTLMTNVRTPGFPDRDDFPVVVQSPYGLGRVTVVAFDLDQSPFVDFAKRADVWDWLIREAGSQRSALVGKDTPNQYSGNFSSTDMAEDEFLGSLRQHIDTFEGVPVVSFGWVALFIVLYTLLIGPVEYLVLKLVLKRLELTWVTFPLIVLSVSAAAYFTAYAIKGNDLKVNKVDVVDVDLAGGRVYGRTWFTIFSPRIDSYTIGVEPRAGWTAARANEPTPPTLVDWMAGSRGGGGGGIVSRGYSYHVDPTAREVADGLNRVPIQVWSTKAFTASWCGYADRGTPLVDADLYHPPGKPEAFVGSFVNNLPVKALKDPVLFYAGKAYKLPTLTPGQRVDVPALGLSADEGWFGREAVLPAANVQTNYGYNSQQQAFADVSLWGALFHEKAIGGDLRPLQNASLRDLDESWRMSDANRDEAILVAKIDKTSGPAEDLMSDPTGPSPSRLWLKGIPSAGAAREPVPGTLRQETYLRVYLPIRAAAARK